MDLNADALLLEDIEHYIRTIDYFDSRVYLYLISSTALQQAHKELKSVHNFILVVVPHIGVVIKIEKSILVCKFLDNTNVWKILSEN